MLIQAVSPGVVRVWQAGRVIAELSSISIAVAFVRRAQGK